MLKKIQILLTAQLVFSLAALAQDIPNPGFETWTTQGNYEDPQGWGTLNSQTAVLGIKTVTKATAAVDIHGGTFAIKLVTSHIGFPYNMNIPGLAATGTINATTKAIDGGFAYAQRPLSISGWYKYSPAGKDTASVEVTLSKWDATNMKRVIIAHAKFLDTAHISSYTAFSIPLTYVGSAVPDTGVIVLLSSQQTSSVINSTLFIDDLAFNITSGINEASSNQNIRVYPNPAAESVHFSGLPANAVGLFIYDVTGKQVGTSKLNAGLFSQNLESFACGLYFYRVLDQNNKVIKEGKVLIHK